MIRIPIHAVAGVLLFAATAPAQSPRGHFRDGLAAFEDGDFAAAAEAFDQAAEAAGETRLDPAVARYNQAKALAAAGNAAQAADLFTRSLRTTDLQLQQQAYHNRGNSLIRQADAAQQAQDLQGAINALQEAQTMFGQAITLDPDDLSPKVNYELAAQRLEELRQQQQEQQQQEQQDQQQEDQEQQDQEQQDQDDQQQQQDDQQQNDQEQDQQQQDQQQQPQQDPQSSESGENDQPQQEPRPSEEMTPEEAEMMLDAIREEEEAERRKVRIQYGQPRRVEKDW